MRLLLTRSGLTMAGVTEKLLVIHPPKLIKPIKFFQNAPAAELMYASRSAMKVSFMTYLLCMGRIDEGWRSAVEAGRNTIGLVPVLPKVPVLPNELDSLIFYCIECGVDRYTVNTDNNLDLVRTECKYAISL